MTEQQARVRTSCMHAAHIPRTHHAAHGAQPRPCIPRAAPSRLTARASRAPQCGRSTPRSAWGWAARLRPCAPPLSAPTTRRASGSTGRKPSRDHEATVRNHSSLHLLTAAPACLALVAARTAAALASKPSTRRSGWMAIIVCLHEKGAGGSRDQKCFYDCFW